MPSPETFHDSRALIFYTLQDVAAEMARKYYRGTAFPEDYEEDDEEDDTTTVVGKGGDAEPRSSKSSISSTLSISQAPTYRSSSTTSSSATHKNASEDSDSISQASTYKSDGDDNDELVQPGSVHSPSSQYRKSTSASSVTGGSGYRDRRIEKQRQAASSKAPASVTGVPTGRTVERPDRATASARLPR